MATIDDAGTNIVLLWPPPSRLGTQQYARITAKEARGMLAPSKSESQSTETNLPFQLNAPGRYPLQDATKLSDVPCYTCRRRHVKCDKILPHCAKCAKKGVACLGYQKPLRWADSTAVRGKLKGKALPAVDGQAVRMTRVVYQESCRSIPKETSHFGLHTTDDCSFDIAVNDASFLDLIDYHNTKICVEHLGSDIATKVVRNVAPLSPEAVQNLPRDLLNCILGNAAVHMAAKNPGNRAIERLALVAKAKLLQRMSQTFRNPREQHADLLLCCITLLFAMESMEHKLTRWSAHYAGALKLLASYGGVENFAIRYPHLKSVLALTLHFDTLQIFFIPHPIDGPRIASRKGLETICYDPNVRKSFFVLCPLKLMQGIYDMRTCMQDVLRAQGIPSLAEVYKRECILSDVLHFQPEEGIRNVKENYYANQELTPLEYRTWNLVFTAWRAAIIIVVLRHLYFGLPDPRTTLGNSLTPPIIEHGAVQTSHHDKRLDLLPSLDNVDVNRLFVENVGQDQEHELSTEQPIAAPASQTPPPLSTPNESMTTSFWDRRLDLHNEVFTELYKSLAAIKQYLDQNLDQQFLRFILIPAMILALVSRANSSERALCQDTFEQFKRYMAEAAKLGAYSPKANPVGGASLDFEIPWDKLDAYNSHVDQERGADMVFGKDGPCNCAPEWNWWYMLKRTELKTIWPISAGTMHMELGTDFWSFSVLSGLIVDDCLEAFMRR